MALHTSTIINQTLYRTYKDSVVPTALQAQARPPCTAPGECGDSTPRGRRPPGLHIGASPTGGSSTGASGIGMSAATNRCVLCLRDRL